MNKKVYVFFSIVCVVPLLSWTMEQKEPEPFNRATFTKNFEEMKKKFGMPTDQERKEGLDELFNRTPSGEKTNFARLEEIIAEKIAQKRLQNANQ